LFGTAGADEKEPSKTPNEKKEGQKQVPTAPKASLYSVTYDVADLVQNPTPWASWPEFTGPHSGANPGPIRVIVTTVFAALRPEIWKGPSETGNSLKVLNGTKLEIVANKEEHGQIAEVLTAFRRLADCAIMIECQLLEVDQAFYKKEIEPKLAKNQPGLGKLGVSPIEDALANQLRKQGTLIASNKKLVPNRKESDFFSLYRAFTYLAKPKSGKDKRFDAFGTAFYGVSFGSEITVSRDRMRIAMKIRQQTTTLRGINKEAAVDSSTGEESEIEVPNLEESSTLSTIEIEDGKFIVQPVHFQFPTAKKKDAILVMLMQPTIFIQEEEDYKKKGK
jgi:hypothetical protein